MTPDTLSVNSRCHEYGGGDYCVIDGVPFVVADADQRIHRIADGPTAVPDHAPSRRLPAPIGFADLVPVDARTLVAVRETHRVRAGNGSPDARQVRNELVQIPTDGSEPPKVLWSRNDFVAGAAISPSGGAIAWVVWDHPSMPWDSSELWVAERATSGELRGARRIAGGPGESVLQPSLDIRRHARVRLRSKRILESASRDALDRRRGHDHDPARPITGIRRGSSGSRRSRISAAVGSRSFGTTPTGNESR